MLAVSMDLLAQMRTFVAVVDGKSLSAAARAQRLSLPAVSRQLQALEREIGTALIVRSTRRLRVTDAGLRWYEHCQRVLGEVERAQNAMRGGGEVGGRLVVSASITFGTLMLMPRLAELARRHPRLEIDLRLEDRLIDLVGEGVDVAIRAGSPPPDSTAFVARPLVTMHRFVVGAASDEAKLRDPRQLARRACLLQVTTEGVIVPWRLVRGEAEVTPEVRGSFRSNAPVALRDLVLEGAGYAYLPDFVVREDLARKRLRRVLPDWTSPPITAWAVHRAELRGSANVRALLDVWKDDRGGAR